MSTIKFNLSNTSRGYRERERVGEKEIEIERLSRLPSSLNFTVS